MRSNILLNAIKRNNNKLNCKTQNQSYCNVNDKNDS